MKTTIKLHDGDIGDGEQILVRCELSNPASPIEVDFCEGEGWTDTQYQSEVTARRYVGLVTVAKKIASDSLQIAKFSCEVEHIPEPCVFYAIADANGLISKRIEASDKHEAMAIAEASGREWIDDPATDIEDQLDFDASYKSVEEIYLALRSRGFHLVLESEIQGRWEIWS